MDRDSLNLNNNYLVCLLSTETNAGVARPSLQGCMNMYPVCLYADVFDWLCQNKAGLINSSSIYTDSVWIKKYMKIKNLPQNLGAFANFLVRIGKADVDHLQSRWRRIP